jgi:hypothetical protein
MLISHGHVVATVVPGRRRNDIARRFGPRARHAGFAIIVSRRQLMNDDDELDVHLLAAARGKASPISFSCSWAPQVVAC